MDRAEAIRKIEYGLEMETSEPTPFGQLTVVRTDALKVALAALLEQEQREQEPKGVEIDQFKNEWVSAKERLPESETEVLVWEWNPNSHEYGREIRFYDPMLYMPGWEYVSHWMPLPMPPKEGADHTCETCYGSNMEHDEVDNPCWNCKGERSEWMPKEGADHE